MLEVLFVYLGMAVCIAWAAVKDDRVQKGFKADATDGDNDGLVQDGTKWERKVKK
jgi:hypothetical protein